MESFSESYKAAGVDITAGYKSVELMKKHVARTNIPGVVSGIGGFGGLFAPDFKGMEEPVLISGTDGVGTKIKLAFLLDKHNTIGIDSVAMCVNDVLRVSLRAAFSRAVRLSAEKLPSIPVLCPRMSTTLQASV